MQQGGWSGLRWGDRVQRQERILSIHTIHPINEADSDQNFHVGVRYYCHWVAVAVYKVTATGGEEFILCIYFSIMFICFKASSKSINLLFAIGGIYSVFIVGINHFSKQNRYPCSAHNHIKSLCWEKCFWDNFTRVCDDWVLTTSIILNNQWRHTELRDDVGCF